MTSEAENAGCWRRRARVAILCLELAGTVTLIALLGWTLLIDDSSTVFRIQARSSTITVIAGEDQPAWPASVPVLPAPRHCAKASFRPSPGSTITVTQRGERPAVLTVSAKNGDATPSAGTFNCADRSQVLADFEVNASLTKADAARAEALPDAGRTGAGRKAPDSIEVGAPAPQPFTLRFAGILTLGAEIDELDPVPMLLESGELTMETEPLIGAGSATSTYRLSKGDTVTFALKPEKSTDGADREKMKAGDEPAPAAFGFISLDRQPNDPLGFHIVARTRANRALILPYGQTSANPVAVAPDLLARAQAGAHSIVLAALAALAMHVLSLLVTWLDLPPSASRREGQT